MGADVVFLLMEGCHRPMFYVMCLDLMVHINFYLDITEVLVILI
jgi:hypothetical protein